MKYNNTAHTHIVVRGIRMSGDRPLKKRMLNFINVIFVCYAIFAYRLVPYCHAPMKWAKVNIHHVLWV